MFENSVDILKKPYSRILIPDEEGGYSAEILEFPGCFAQGETPNEAFENLENAAKAWVEASQEQGLDIPSPAENHKFSGKIVLRMPRSLHKKVAKLSERDGTSINQFLVTSIATRVGAEDYHYHLCNQFWKGFGYFVQNQVNIQSVQVNNKNIFVDNLSIETKSNSISGEFILEKDKINEIQMTSHNFLPLG